LFGTLVPIIFDKLKIDPAVASGPFITTLNDLISVTVYFSLAIILLGLYK
jgi:magnesium transporter